MPVTVRRAAAPDAAIITEFNRLLAEESEGKVLDPLVLRAGVEAGLADENKALYFVAEVDSEVLGQVMITREWSDWRNGWLWWVQSVYVRADARGRGLFRALFEHIRAIAHADPEVVGLRLYVEQENRSAQQIYERLGMSRTGYFVLERYPL